MKISPWTGSVSCCPNHYVELNIQPLDQQAGEVLINNLLEIQGLPYTLRRKIIERSGGNPFFIEEVIRSLIDEGAIVRKGESFGVTEKIDTVLIPPTINGVLMARIDRLEERTRELVKVASVIGRSFFDRVLKDVAASIEDIDKRIAYLKELQLIRERMRMEELEYLFKHALAQEVAYQSTLLQQRKDLHRQVALSIEKLFQDRLHEFYGLLASHYSRAEDLEKAEEWMTRAGGEGAAVLRLQRGTALLQEALRLYINKSGASADPEKLSGFEKNIALAYFNRGDHKNTVLYIDKVFQRWGRHLPGTQLGILTKLTYDWLTIWLKLSFSSVAV